MGTTIQNRGYIPLMIFSVLFTAFIVLIACRCKHRSRNKNKVRGVAQGAGLSASDRTFTLKKVGDMPDVEHQTYSPVVGVPEVRDRNTERADVAAAPDRDTERADVVAAPEVRDRADDNCNGANSGV